MDQSAGVGESAACGVHLRSEQHHGVARTPGSRCHSLNLSTQDSAHLFHAAYTDPRCHSVPPRRSTSATGEKPAQGVPPNQVAAAGTLRTLVDASVRLTVEKWQQAYTNANTHERLTGRNNHVSKQRRKQSLALLREILQISGLTSAERAHVSRASKRLGGTQDNLLCSS